MGRKITAKHAILAESCLQAHGSPEAAVDEALARLRKEALGILNGWGRPLQIRLHFRLEIEKPPLEVSP